MNKGQTAFTKEDLLDFFEALNDAKRPEVSIFRLEGYWYKIHKNGYCFKKTEHGFRRCKHPLSELLSQEKKK